MISSAELDRIAGDCLRLGVKRLKTVDIELELDLERFHVSQKPTQPDRYISPEPVSSHIVPPVAANSEATEKLKGLIETLKMPDEQLLDQIFPAGAGG